METNLGDPGGARPVLGEVVDGRDYVVISSRVRAVPASLPGGCKHGVGPCAVEGRAPVSSGV